MDFQEITCSFTPVIFAWYFVMKLAPGALLTYCLAVRLSGLAGNAWACSHH
jgi:hypothetical protein